MGDIKLKKVILVSAGLLAGLALTTYSGKMDHATTPTTVNASQVVTRTSHDNVSLSSLQPKEVAAAALVAGAKDNDAWSNLADSATNDDGDLEVDVVSADGVTQTGTGKMYLLTLDGNDAGMVNGYTLSADGSTVYLYSEGMHDSGERTVAPFKTVSARHLVKLAHSNASVDDIASNVSIEVDDD